MVNDLMVMSGNVNVTVASHIQRMFGVTVLLVKLVLFKLPS